MKAFEEIKNKIKEMLDKDLIRFSEDNSLVFYSPTVEDGTDELKEMVSLIQGNGFIRVFEHDALSAIRGVVQGEMSKRFCKKFEEV